MASMKLHHSSNDLAINTNHIRTMPWVHTCQGHEHIAQKHACDPFGSPSTTFTMSAKQPQKEQQEQPPKDQYQHYIPRWMLRAFQESQAEPKYVAATII